MQDPLWGKVGRSVLCAGEWYEKRQLQEESDSVFRPCGGIFRRACWMDLVCLGRWSGGDVGVWASSDNRNVRGDFGLSGRRNILLG